MALILALARRLLQLDKGFREKDWSIRQKVNIQRLDGKNIGFIGFGRLAVANTSIDMPSSSNFLAALKATGCAGTVQPAPGRICASK